MKNKDFLFSESLSDAMNRLCDKYVTNGPLSHLHLFLSVKGQVVADHFTGAACADGTPLRVDSLYRLASMTKPVTIAAILILAERGLLSITDPIAGIIPEFVHPRIWDGTVGDDGELSAIPSPRGITILDLLRHSAGLTYSIHHANALDRLYAERNLDAFHQRRSVDEYAADLASLPLLYPPGERFHYSVSIDVLAIVIERVTGRRAEDFIAEALFAPLAMKDSHFVVPADKLHRLTDAWLIEKPGEEPVVYDRGAHSRWRMTPKCVSTGGGLISGVRDYHRFLSMLMQGGELDGVRVLSPESVALMMRNHLIRGGDLRQEGAAPSSETQQEGVGMGLGAAVLLDPEKAAVPGSRGTWYWGGILSTGFFLDPQRRMIGLVMTQLMPSGATRLREDFRRAIYEAMEER